MKRITTSLLMLSGFVLANPALAATFVVTNGSAATFASSQTAGPGDKVVTFNGATPAGTTVTLNNAAIVTGDMSGQYAEPAFSDGSPFLAVFGGGSATVQSTTGPGFNSLSFYLGSIDTGNTVDVLGTAGAVIASFAGSAFLSGPSGDQELATTNRLVTISRSGNDPLFGGISFRSEQNAAEVDNVRFLAAAVPEPATWATMLLGFGFLGAAMRRKRSPGNVRVRFA